MISLEVPAGAVKDGKVQEITLVLDKEGIDSLISQLKFLNPPVDHTHLMSEEWGGYELESKATGENSFSIPHLRIQLFEK